MNALSLESEVGKALFEALQGHPVKPEHQDSQAVDLIIANWKLATRQNLSRESSVNSYQLLAACLLNSQCSASLLTLASQRSLESIANQAVEKWYEIINVKAGNSSLVNSVAESPF